MDIGGGAASGAQEEVLVPGLAWGMRNLSSIITRRDETQTYAPGLEWTCEQNRMIRVHLSSSNQ